MKRRLIPFAFLMIIFTFGAAVTLKSAGSIVRLVSAGDLNSGTSSEIEAILQDKMYQKQLWIDIHGLAQRALGRTVVEDDAGNTVYKMDSGSITLVEAHKGGSRLDKFADNTAKLRDRIPADTDLVYVQLPHKVRDSEDLPPGVVSYADDNADRLVSRLRDRGIEVFDIRDCIDSEEGRAAYPDRSSLFYVTDHHWRPQTACMAADRISAYLAENHVFEYDPSLFAESSMQTETFDRLFLGSVGRRTGSLYAGVDDFELVTPSYETSFDFTSYPGDTVIHREGSFREALIDDGNLKKDYYNINNYASYTGDSTKTTTTINTGEPLNDKKVLLVRDSYSCALQPFLSLGIKEITTIDLRYYRDDTVIDHINKNDYDLVIVAYTPVSFDGQRFSFHKIPG